MVKTKKHSSVARLLSRQVVCFTTGMAVFIHPSSAEAIPKESGSASNSAKTTLKPVTVNDATKESALRPISQESLQKLIDTAARELLIPGAVVLLRTPQGEYTVAYGTTELGKKSPPSVNTYFRIASNTKTMTSAVILQLAQEGKLKLSDTISKYVSGVPNGEKITIAELLKMRSGLYNCTDAPQLSSTIDKDPSKIWTPDEVLSLAFKRPVNAQPDTTYEYNNTNYVLLGIVAEKVDGRPLSKAMQERLFKPLHMASTILPPSIQSTIPKPYSHGYLYGSSSVALQGTPAYTPEVKAAAKAGNLLPRDFTNVNHSFATGAGGVISTASDVATWIRALSTGKVLNDEYQRLWIDSQQLEDPKKPEGMLYGYGISKLHWSKNSIYFHGGETVGFNSFIGCDPSNQMTLVVWTNLTVSLDQVPTANTLMLKVLDHIYVSSPLTPRLVVPKMKQYGH